MTLSSTETPSAVSLVAAEGQAQRGPSSAAVNAGSSPRPDSDASAGSATWGSVARTTPAEAELTFTVHGLPAPQGSKRGYVVNGRAVLVESSKRVRPWREAVKHAALDAMSGQQFTAAVPLSGPLGITVVYTLPRPKSHYRTGRNAHLLRDGAPAWPAGKPDVEKLDRATYDAMTDAGVWGDDAQIVCSLSIKSYPGGHPRAITTPGAHIRIYRMGDEQ